MPFINDGMEEWVILLQSKGSKKVQPEGKPKGASVFC